MENQSKSSNKVIVFIKEILWSFILSLILSMLLGVWVLFDYVKSINTTTVFITLGVSLFSCMTVIFFIRSILKKKTNLLSHDIVSTKDNLTLNENPQFYPRIPYDEKIYINLTLKCIKQTVLVQILGLIFLIVNFIFIKILVLYCLIMIIVYITSSIILINQFRDTVDNRYGSLAFFGIKQWDFYSSTLKGFSISFIVLMFISNFFTEKIDKSTLFLALIPFFMLTLVSMLTLGYKGVRVAFVRQKHLILINSGIVLFWIVTVVILNFIRI